MQLVQSELNLSRSAANAVAPNRYVMAIVDACRPAAPVLAAAAKLLLKGVFAIVVVAPLAVVLTVFSVCVARGLGVPVLGATPNTELFRR